MKDQYKYYIRMLTSLLVGILFAIGLGLSGMTQPQKVIGFLNILGDWDPSLAFVMIGAIGIHALAYRLIVQGSRWPRPLADHQWHIPHKREITPQLVIGAMLFGLGWGLGGYCPGPALVLLTSDAAINFTSGTGIFVLSMLAGMGFYQLLTSTKRKSL